MSIPASPTPVRTDIPPTAPPGTEAAALGNATDRRKGSGIRLPGNNMLGNMLIKGVFGLMETWKGPGISRQVLPRREPARPPYMLHLMYTEYKTVFNDAMTLLGGVARPELRPFLSAAKTGMMNHAGVNAYLKGFNFNPYSGVVNAVGGAIVGLFSAATFFKGSHLKTAADLALKNMLGGSRNPVTATMALDSGSIVKALLTVGMTKITGELTKDLAVRRPETAGDQLTKTDEKNAKKLLCLMAYYCSMGAIIALPSVKESMANSLLDKFKDEIAYDDLLKDIKTAVPDTVAFTKLKNSEPIAALAAARAKSIRVETAQQMSAMTLALIMFTAITKVLNTADAQNSDSYQRAHKQKMEKSHGK